MGKLFIGIVVFTAAVATAGCSYYLPANRAPAVKGSTSDLVSTGYRMKMQDGVQYYCQRQLPTGTRVSAKEVCLTEQELRKEQERNQKLVRDMQSGVGAEQSSLPPGQTAFQ